jgi:adenylate cyclase
VADAAMGIVEADDVAGLDGVGRRAGLGAGEMRVRDGDYVGNAVNVAARLTDLARPDSLVVDEGAVERMNDHWRRSRLPSTKIKGLGRSRPVRVRRPAALDEEAAEKKPDRKSKGKSEKKG